MNNLNRNTRTLIVCFLIAIFALIPLRFIEAGQQQNYMMQSQVLGETIEKKVEKQKDTQFELEAPYAEMEKCFNQEEIEATEKEVEILLTEISEKKSNICQ